LTGTHHVVREVAIAPDEPLFAGHYPGFPVVPGMFVLELVHRAVCADRGIPGLPCAVERAQFHRPVRPGQTLRIEAELRALDGGLVASVTAHVAGELAAELRLWYPGAAA
jgi:3-hydroxyacyl-[acyl-carrier-protein] dehydratase